MISVDVLPGPMSEGPELLAQTRHEDTDFRFRTKIGAVILAVSGIVGGILGAAHGSTTPAEFQLGPNVATVRMTHTAPWKEGVIKIDTGAPGYGDRLTGLPGGIGAEINVGQIPVPLDQTALHNATAVVAQYEQLGVNPEHIKESAIKVLEKQTEDEAVRDAALVGAIGFSLFGASELLRRRRQEDSETLQSLDLSETDRSKVQKMEARAGRTHRIKVATALSATAILLGGVTYEQGLVKPTSSSDLAVDHALDGTPLQGFSIHGEALQLIAQNVIPPVEQYIEDDQKFYAKVSANFATAFNEKFGQNPLQHEGFTYLLSVSDNHCNIGMDSVHAKIAHMFGANLVVDSGDTTMSGTAAEGECVTEFADGIRKYRIRTVAVRGNHDSTTTEDQERKAGEIVVGSDKMVTVDGLTFLGVGDWRETRIGAGTKPYDPNYTAVNEGNDLARAAAQLHPDILLVHDPNAAMQTIENGDAHMSISGDKHVLSGPNLLNSNTMSYQFTEGTSGGAKLNALTVGPLMQPAIEVMFIFDKETRRPVGYYIVTSNPDTSVTISDFTPMPVTLAANAPKPTTSGD